MSTAHPVTLAVGDYDHTRDLASGQVPVDGVSLVCVSFETPEELFSRFLAGEFDAAEMSLAICSALCCQGETPYLALPVFPARSFRHSAIYVRSGGLLHPNELDGRRVGVPAWAQTAGIYARGILADRHGVDLASIEWVQAGVDEPGREEPVELDLGPFSVTPAPDRSLDDLLLTGDVDAVISARPPRAVVDEDPRVRHLFADPVREEVAYFRDTGVFPIMHVVVLRRQLAESEPAVAAALITAFEHAKRRSLDRARRATVPSYPLPWAPWHARDARALMGDDPWPYGLEPNRAALETFLRYAVEQHVCSRQLSPEELFASSILHNSL